MKISALVDARKLSEFVGSRRNSDGGYSFSYPIYGFEFPSSISETYYALAILSMLGEEIPDGGNTLEYLRSIQSESGRYSSPSVAFHAVKALRLLGEKPARTGYLQQLQEAIAERRALFEEFDSTWFSADYDAGDSPFRPAFCSARVLKMAGADMNWWDFEWMIRRRQDGGFGAAVPDVISTYYVLSALSCAGYDINKFAETAGFIERCDVPGGGYSPVPHGAPAFVETTYFAIAALRILGKQPTNAKEHLLFLQGLQAHNGGFRRSTEIGIATLANSYYATKAIGILSGDGNSNN